MSLSNSDKESFAQQDIRHGKDMVEIAVFDFDGTCINGNSPVLLVRYLWSRRMVRASVVLRIMLWGLMYLLHLPQNEAWVRGLVFSAFENMPCDQTDDILSKFYKTQVAPLLRPEALKEIASLRQKGCEVWIVSASFDTIIETAGSDIPYTHQFSTKMKKQDGHYTSEVDGLPVEGREKWRLVESYANQRYGEDNWRLSHAYGDHYSDTFLLEHAEIPCAVTPDLTLKRTAKKNGWRLAEW